MNTSATNKHNDLDSGNGRRYLRICLSLLAVSILLTATGQDKPKKNDWVMENLLEKVKTVRQTCYEAIDKSGESTKGRRIDNSLVEDYSNDFENTYSIYNKNGYIEAKYGYNANDSLLGRNNYKYDSNWNLVEVNTYDSKDILITNSTYKYDADGNQIESSVYSSGRIYYKAIDKYDDKGNQVETEFFGVDGAPNGKTTYKYDDKGNQVEMKRYDSDGRYDSKVIQKYNDKGKMIEDNVYKADGRDIGYKNTIKYDDQGHAVEKSSLKPDGSYDYKWAYKFDERKNVVEWSWYKSDGRLDGKFTYTYKYDTKGNWIMKTIHLNNIPKYIYEREIEYYE